MSKPAPSIYICVPWLSPKSIQSVWTREPSPSGYRVIRYALAEDSAPAPKPRRRHSRSGQVHCELCAPLRCGYAR